MRALFLCIALSGCAGGSEIDRVSADAGSDASDRSRTDAARPSDAAPPPSGDATVATLRVAHVVTGESHLCARFDDGKVCCAGDGHRIGARGTASSAVLVDVPELSSGVTSLSASPMHTCAIKSDGSVWCWGDETNYALGDGMTTAAEGAAALGSGPVRAAIPSASPARGLGTGSWSSCALLEDGSTYCWGRQDADLGDGGRYYQAPTLVSNLGAALELAQGWGLRCARTSGGASCWGSMSAGTGTYAYGRPTAVEGIPPSITAISVGGNHACALDGDRRVLCWGNNSNGALGDGTTESLSTPAHAGGLEDVAQIAAGGSHVCARTSAGAVYCWGSNASGELGLPLSTYQVETPTRVEGLPAVVDLSASFGTTCARTAQSELYCWGHIGLFFGEVSVGMEGREEGLGEPIPTPRAIPATITCEQPTLF